MTDSRGKVLLVGDSISIGYAPHAAAELDGTFAVVHHEGNSGDSANMREKLDDWLAADADARIIHVNVGLHDLRLSKEDGTHQVPLEAYRDNLQWITARLKATGAAVIWAMTTPVVQERIDAGAAPFTRRLEDVIAYNAAAREIVDAAGIAINDLFALVEAEGREQLVCPDGTHFTDAGYALLGHAVAQSIREASR